MNAKQELLKLVRHAFGWEPYSFPGEVLSGVFPIAKDNGLSGLLYESLDPSWLSAEDLHRFKKDYFQYLKRDTLQMDAVKQLHRLFHEQGIDHMFLKGTRLKRLYPQTYWRSMGDIDVLIRPESMKQAHLIMDSLGYDNISNSDNHDMFVKNRDVVVEVHPKLANESTEKHNAMFDDVWKTASEIKEHEFAFPAEVELVYLLVHLAKHFSTSGVGLRSVLDIGVFLWKNGDQIDVGTLRVLLEEAKLSLFYDNMVRLNHRWFGFPIRSYAIDDDIDCIFADALLDYLIVSGVHGKGTDFNSYLAGLATRTAETGTVSKGRLRFFLKMAFPSRIAMKSTYPYLEKHGWLLPIAWIQRFWRLLFRKTKRTFRNIGRLRVDKKSILETSVLYQKLGL